MVREAEHKALLSVEDVASMLRLDPQTIYRKCKQKKIPHKRFGKIYRFDHDEIMKFLSGEGA